MLFGAAGDKNKLSNPGCTDRLLTNGSSPLFEEDTDQRWALKRETVGYMDLLSHLWFPISGFALNRIGK